MKERRPSGAPVLAEVGPPVILSLGVAGYLSVSRTLRGGPLFEALVVRATTASRRIPRNQAGEAITRRAFGIKALAGALAVGCLACESDEAKEFRSQVVALAQRNASLDDTTATLGKGFVYEKDKDSWRGLLAFVAREPEDATARLRAQMERYPIIVCYSDSEWITWLAFDSSRSLREWFQEVQ